MSIQKCQKCDNPATHKVTRIENGKALDLYLCQEHAAEISPLQQKTSQIDLAQLLAGLLKKEQGKKAEVEEAERTGLKCPTCGLSFREYRKTWLLGCGDCYEAFEKPLKHDLRQHHGTVRHCSRQPVAQAQSAWTDERMEALRKRLALAIEDEDFELAARLRDEIRTIKTADTARDTDTVD